jgi:hypothetical protein
MGINPNHKGEGTMNKTATKKPTFWTDLNGRTCCPDHMGCYADVILKQNPRTRVIQTDLTVWERMTAAEIAEWSEYLAAEYGETELCETCKWEAKSK